MILAIDIGNTTVKLAGIDAETEKVVFSERLKTVRERAYEEYLADIRALFAGREFEGAVMSSVVPPVAEKVCAAVKEITGAEPMNVTVHTDMGLEIDLPEPDKVGKDRYVDAAWAAENLTLPAVTADLGTATTLNVVGRGGVFLGGVIACGLSTGLNALAERAAQLPEIPLRTPEHIIGKNTTECMLTGAVAGTAAMLDGILSDIEDELGETVSFIITGGTARYVVPLLRHEHIYDPELTLKGLALIYRKNRA